MQVSLLLTLPVSQVCLLMVLVLLDQWGQSDPVFPSFQVQLWVSV